jgi:HK97 family phage major capsid protein
VIGGTNGLAPAYSHIIDLESQVAQDNAAVGSLAYITNTKVRAKLKQLFTNATYGEIPLWSGGRSAGVGVLNSYPAFATNQVSSALTKGSASEICSAIFFGNWKDLIIGLWSGFDLLVDPYTHSAKGALRITAFQSVDVGVKHAESFSVMLDALTA